MRTSATGRADIRPRCDHGEQGFTLIELLVVLVLLGLMSAAVIVAMPDPRGALVAEAERFAARTAAAQEKAITDARAMAVRVGAAGYGFDVREAGAWRPLDRKPFVDQAWSEGVTAGVGGEEIVRITLDPTGIAVPARILLQRDGEQVAVEIGADGNVRVGS